MIVFLRLTSHAVLPTVKKRSGDIRVTAGCEVEHLTPPERLESAKGRVVMMCQPASHHVWLPARRSSPVKSVYIIDRMKNSKLSQMQSVVVDTMGATCTPVVFTFVCVSMPEMSLRMYESTGKITCSQNQAVKINLERFHTFCKYVIYCSPRSEFDKFSSSVGGEN